VAKRGKIGLLIPNLQSGGAERVISLTSELLTDAGYDVYIFLFDSENISYPYKGTLIDLKSIARNNIFNKVTNRLLRIIKLSFLKYKYDIDVVISFLYSANVVNYYSIGKSKKIVACRGYSDYVKNGQIYNKFIKRIDAFIVQTERMKSDFINDFYTDASKISVITNPFEISVIQNKAKEDIEDSINKFITTHKCICTVGTIKKDKGYWHLIKAFTKVKESIPDAGLIFIGHRGEMESDIKNMADSTGYKDDILFIGYQENPFKYLSKCDLYVSTSLNEGFPNAIIEAMACGLPVISTDCKTGPREILCDIENVDMYGNSNEGTYGILVPNLSSNVDFDTSVVDEEESFLAEQIVTLISDKSRLSEFSKASLKRSRDFDTSYFINKLIKIL
jgi:glycosyltransferase involved in cell wall biosynthesis